jgi:hypothetical protein
MAIALAAFDHCHCRCIAHCLWPFLAVDEPYDMVHFTIFQKNMQKSMTFQLALDGTVCGSGWPAAAGQWPPALAV